MTTSSFDSDGVDSTALKAKIPREIWILVISAFLIAMGYGLIAPILPQFVVTFDVTMAAAGAVVSVFSFSRFITAPVAGTLGDKLGSRRVYLTGLVIVAVTTGLVALAQAYWHIIVLRAIAGLGSSMFSISAWGLVVKLAPPNSRGRASALYSTSFLLGNVIGPIAGASLSFLGMRWPFVIYGVGVLLAALVVWWLMPNQKIDRMEEAQSDAEASDEDSEALPPITLKEAWQDSAFRSLLVSNFAHGWINMGVRVATVPLFAAAVFDDSAAIAGLAMAAFAAGNAIVLQFSGRTADSVGRRPLIIAGLIGMGVFTSLLGFAETPALLLIVSALAGAFAGMLNPAQQAVLADVIGNQRSGGKVLSVYQMCMDAGQILGPVVVGWLADMFGFRVAFAAGAVVALIGLIAWLFGRETLPTANKKAR